MKYVDSTDGTTFYVKRSLTVPYYRDTKNILLNRYYISSLDNFLKQYPSATFTGVNNTYSYSDKPYISLTILPLQIATTFLLPYFKYVGQNILLYPKYIPPAT